jgi:hypothetical protein
VNRMLRALLCAGALLLLLAPAASAAGRDDIIRDCADDGRLDGKYSQSEIRDARRNLPTDVDEYTDCRDVLRRAELPSSGGAGGSSGSGSGGAGTTSGGSSGGTGGGSPFLSPSGPAESKALDDARKGSGASVSVGGEPVVPGAAGFAAGAARHDLPWPLLAVLILLALAAAAAAVPPIRRRVGSRHRTA